VVEEIAIEPTGQFTGVIHSATQALRDISQIDAGTQIFFGIAYQKTLTKIGERRTTLESKIGSSDRSARYS